MSPRRIQKLFKFEQAPGLLMLGAMLLAFVAANSPWSEMYAAIHHTPVHFRIGSLVIDRPLFLWINEGLMVFFFVLVGLELKRQFLEGQLSSPRQIALPGLAALGGMAVPATIYVLFNGSDTAALRGWAIPTATDIVLALGILSLLGARVPVSLKVFLAALAIFDDLGAIAIIAIFYSEQLAIGTLVLPLVGVAALVVANQLNITRMAVYVVVGLFLWITVLESGVHATLAGVAIGFAVPMRVPGIGGKSPLRRMEQKLHPWVGLGIVPAFAFFNSGISFSGFTLQSLLSPIFIGIALGLFVGKQIGVFGTTWLVIKLGIAKIPHGADWRQVYGIALLAGIGFTMSLFVGTLAFAEPETAASAKLGILVGSILSALVGIAVLQTSQNGDMELATSARGLS